MQINPLSWQPVNLPPTTGQGPAAVPSTSQADLDQKKQKILTDIDTLLIEVGPGGLTKLSEHNSRQLDDLLTEVENYIQMLPPPSQPVWPGNVVAPPDPRLEMTEYYMRSLDGNRNLSIMIPGDLRSLRDVISSFE
jgi:hypothetical protein